MKRFVYGLALLGLMGWSLWSWKQNESPSPLPATTPLPASTVSTLGLSKNEQALHAFEVEGKKYRIAWHSVSPTATVVMGLNIDLASTSSEIYDDRQCKILTSGGFYTPEGKPIGLLVVEGQEISPWQQNSLFTGVLGSDGTGFDILMGEAADKSYTWAVQAGPVVWLNRSVTRIQLKNDQAARRILAGVTTDGSLVLMAVVAEDSLFGGPYLADVGSMIPTIAGIVGKEFEAVINLDGGTASALLSESISLRELKPIGNYMCVR